MAKQKRPAPIRDKIEKLLKKNPQLTNAELTELTGGSESTIRRIAGSNASRGVDTLAAQNAKVKVEQGPGCTCSYGTTEAKVEFRTNKHIKDIDTALEEQGVDLMTWEVYNVKTIDNAWDVHMKLRSTDKDGKTIERPHGETNYQFKIQISLRRRKDAPVMKAFERLIEHIPQIKIPEPELFATETGRALAVAPIDAHFGKLGWAKETGRRDYDLKIAREDYLEGIQKVTSWGEPFEVERYFYVVGQDLMHTENYMGQTPLGHNPLDIDSRLPKIFETAFDTVITTIGMLAQRAPVTVIHVQGNHDPHASLYLCIALKKIFDGNANVEVLVSPLQRKAIKWGKLLVGMQHELVGKQTTWANELMQQFPQEFADTEYHEIWHGHKHKKGEVKVFPIITHGGVLMRQLTALSPIDRWHYDNLFTDASPGIEAFLMDKRHGVIANFTYYTDKPQITKGLCNEY